MQNFTTDDLLLYLYGELNPQQSQLLENALQKDWALQQKLLVLKESVDQLEEFRLSKPRTRTIDSVMLYAELKHVLQ